MDINVNPADLPKRWNGDNKTIDIYSTKYDAGLDGWVMFHGVKDISSDYYFTTGSQKNGTQLIKVYKSLDTVRRAFAKKYDTLNQSPYVNHYAILNVIHN